MPVSQPPDIRSPRFMDWLVKFWKGVAQYEQGDWTPVLTFATPGNLSVSYSVQYGHYAILGNNLVMAVFDITTSAFTHTTAANNLRVTGLPKTVSDASGYRDIGSLAWQGITKANYTQVNPTAVAGQTYCEFGASGSAQSSANIAAGDVPSGGTVLLRGRVFYHYK